MITQPTKAVKGASGKTTDKPYEHSSSVDTDNLSNL